MLILAFLVPVVDDSVYDGATPGRASIVARTEGPATDRDLEAEDRIALLEAQLAVVIAGCLAGLAVDGVRRTVRLVAVAAWVCTRVADIRLGVVA